MTDGIHSVPHLSDPLELTRAFNAWASDNWPAILTALGAGLIIYAILLLLRGYGARLLRHGEQHTPLLGVIAQAVAHTTQSFIVLATIRLVADVAAPPAAVLTAISFIFTIVAVIQAAIWARAIMLGYIDLRTHGEAGSETLTNASGLIRVLVTTAVFAIALIVVLDNLGVNVTGLVAGLGIGGIAIGLAAQGIFSDLFAALSILFDRPFQVGEAISFDGSAGTVERIGLKTTRLRAVTGEKRIISNANLFGKDIISYAGLDRRRCSFAIGLIYQTPPEDAAKVPELLKEIVEGHGATFVRAGFIGFGASSIDFSLDFDVMSGNWDEVFIIRHKVGLAILDKFNTLGLSFAYPTQTTFTADPEGKMIMPYPASLAAPGSAG